MLLKNLSKDSAAQKLPYRALDDRRLRGHGDGPQRTDLRHPRQQAIPANKMPAQTLFSPLCSEALPNVADPEGQIICVQNLQQNRGFGGSYSGQWEAQGAAAS
jgi:hypothetical protein